MDRDDKLLKNLLLKIEEIKPDESFKSGISEKIALIRSSSPITVNRGKRCNYIKSVLKSLIVPALFLILSTFSIIAIFQYIPEDKLPSLSATAFNRAVVDSGVSFGSSVLSLISSLGNGKNLIWSIISINSLLLLVIGRFTESRIFRKRVQNSHR